MSESEEFVKEAISGMAEKVRSLKEKALTNYESWLEAAIKLALNNEDETKVRVKALTTTMSTPSSLFYVGFIHGYAYRGSDMQKTNGSETQ